MGPAIRIERTTCGLQMAYGFMLKGLAFRMDSAFSVLASEVIFTVFTDSDGSSPFEE
jgi:hypothetical protein